MGTNEQRQRVERDSRSISQYSSEWRDNADLPTRLTYALASEQDEHPERFETGLTEVVDPDALDRLFTSNADSTAGHLTLTLCGHDVHIRADGSFLLVGH